MARILGQWDDEALQGVAHALLVDGLDAWCWRFLPEDKVVLVVRDPETSGDVRALSRAVRKDGARPVFLS